MEEKMDKYIWDPKQWRYYKEGSQISYASLEACDTDSAYVKHWMRVDKFERKPNGQHFITEFTMMLKVDPTESFCCE